MTGFQFPTPTTFQGLAKTLTPMLSASDGEGPTPNERVMNLLFALFMMGILAAVALGAMVFGFSRGNHGGMNDAIFKMTPGTFLVVWLFFIVIVILVGMARGRKQSGAVLGDSAAEEENFALALVDMIYMGFKNGLFPGSPSPSLGGPMGAVILIAAAANSEADLLSVEKLCPQYGVKPDQGMIKQTVEQMQKKSLIDLKAHGGIHDTKILSLTDSSSKILVRFKILVAR